MKKINVNIYGGKSIFGGREEPYNVDVAYCDKCDKCDFYKNGTCFNAGRFKGNCKIGKKENIKGWTSRAAKGREFYSRWKNDECYYKLKEPNQTIGIVEDIVILSIHDMKLNENNIPVEDVGFGNGTLSYIPLKDFTPKLIKQICDLRPRTIFYNVPIRAYYDKYIPKFLDDLKRNYKKIWNEFVSTYPEYDKEINYVGREAYISTLNNGSELKDCHSNIWRKEDNEIICYNLRTFIMLPFGRTPTEVRIKITDDMYCKVTDNSQVNGNTRFYD